ncbi:hypothetical protein B0T17DRAFT_80527 [Bombardia bombarda]|uniref:Tat pathway signal sequence n=1 Tax=Bombardia bombarda TaxID=252184 RepID=A0AA39XLS1_9PEZI|nr:hypothetical protein B0T17DRAFT_80527 [Bombardia bombarda]
MPSVRYRDHILRAYRRALQLAGQGDGRHDVGLDTKYDALGKSPSDSAGEEKEITRDGTSRPLLFIILNTALVAAYLGVFAYGVRDLIYGGFTSGLIYTPARSIVSYETRVIDQSVRTPFQGGPSLEADAAWIELLRYNNLVVQKYDVDQIGKPETSVQLRDKSGYLSGLDVIHELHCLNYIREFAYSDYYALHGQKKNKDEHIFHCIDHIREILMCHGDVAMHTYEWSPTKSEPVMKPQATHVCRKWEPIAEYARTHSPSHRNGPILEHPLLGIIYPTHINKTQAQG